MVDGLGEQGAARGEQSLRGCYPEDRDDFTRLDAAGRLDRLILGGRSIDEIEDVSGKKPVRFTPYIGGGAGGSSALYGMVLERLFASDFTPRGNFQSLGASTIPESWPIDYQQLRPWYARAEELYQVHGAPDPLRPGDVDCRLIPSPPLTPANAELAEHLHKQGLHPYQMHMGCEHLPE